MDKSANRFISIGIIGAFCIFILCASSVIAKPSNEGTVDGIDAVEKTIVINTKQYRIADSVSIRNFAAANTLSAIKVGQLVLFSTNVNNEIIEIWVAPDDPKQRKLFDLGQSPNDGES